MQLLASYPSRLDLAFRQSQANLLASWADRHQLRQACQPLHERTTKKHEMWPDLLEQLTVKIYLPRRPKELAIRRHLSCRDPLAHSSRRPDALSGRRHRQITHNLLILPRHNLAPMMGKAGPIPARPIACRLHTMPC